MRSWHLINSKVNKYIGRCFFQTNVRLCLTSDYPVLPLSQCWNITPRLVNFMFISKPDFKFPWDCLSWICSSFRVLSFFSRRRKRRRRRGRGRGRGRRKRKRNNNKKDKQHHNHKGEGRGQDKKQEQHAETSFIISIMCSQCISTVAVIHINVADGFKILRLSQLLKMWND